MAKFTSNAFNYLKSRDQCSYEIDELETQKQKKVEKWSQNCRSTYVWQIEKSYALALLCALFGMATVTLFKVGDLLRSGMFKGHKLNHLVGEDFEDLISSSCFVHGGFGL